MLAAADMYRALIGERPHRPAFDPQRAAATLMAEAATGKLDRGAVTAVLSATGLPMPSRRREGAAGLTEREIDVTRLLARGLSEKEAAAALHVSKSTVHTHVQHIYKKTGLSSRAGLALFAIENGS